MQISSELFKGDIENPKSISLKEYVDLGHDNLNFLFAIYENRISLETKALALRLLQRFLKIKNYSDSVVDKFQFWIIVALQVAMKLS